jgi:hypothetical protein
MTDGTHFQGYWPPFELSIVNNDMAERASGPLAPDYN